MTMQTAPETLRKAADKLDNIAAAYSARLSPDSPAECHAEADAMRLGAKALRCHADIYSDVPLEARATALVEVSP